MTHAGSRLPSGEAVLRRLGAEIVQEQQFIQLTLSHAAQSAHPEARIVRAGNTPDNTGMPALTRALSFRTYLVHTDWQMETAALAAYLEKSH